jgi:RNA polymerase sigma-70 factor (ECF subfamily)
MGFHRRRETREKVMTEAQSFRELIARVRNGDDRAAEELVGRYESTIRMAIRVRLDQSDLRRLLDSVDICQSVLANFFVRAASGQFDLDTPAQLIKLLVTMARNRLINHVHHQQAARRDCRRRDGNAQVGDIADLGPSPSQVIAYRELLEVFRGRLTEEERKLADLRALGRSWKEVAVAAGGHPEALRFRLTRALDRVARELRLEE